MAYDLHLIFSGGAVRLRRFSLNRPIALPQSGAMRRHFQQSAQPAAEACR